MVVVDDRISTHFKIRELVADKIGIPESYLTLPKNDLKPGDITANLHPDSEIRDFMSDIECIKEVSNSEQEFFPDRTWGDVFTRDIVDFLDGEGGFNDTHSDSYFETRLPNVKGVEEAFMRNHDVIKIRDGKFNFYYSRVYGHRKALPDLHGSRLDDMLPMLDISMFKNESKTVKTVSVAPAVAIISRPVPQKPLRLPPAVYDKPRKPVRPPKPRSKSSTLVRKFIEDKRNNPTQFREYTSDPTFKAEALKYGYTDTTANTKRNHLKYTVTEDGVDFYDFCQHISIIDDSESFFISVFGLFDDHFYLDEDMKVYLIPM